MQGPQAGGAFQRRRFAVETPFAREEQEPRQNHRETVDAGVVAAAEC